MDFGRTAEIPFVNASVPNPEPHPGGSDDLDNVQMVSFPQDEDSWKTDGFGPFYCRGRKPGRDVTTVTTFFTRSDGTYTSFCSISSYLHFVEGI